MMLTSEEGNVVLGESAMTTVIIAANDDQHGVILFDPAQPVTMYINEDQASPTASLTIKREGGMFGQVILQTTTRI